ncbi:MAG: DeoR/GlpR transcriptional regulator [Actinobacteria bacterium]|nr:DeoR/GlpR transcriptional regulator [Actinomycetota bacterium]
MLGEERRQYILNLISKTGSIKAIDLARTLNLSEITIRRDLDRLAEKGLIKRTHGGAINKFSVGFEMKFDVQKDKFIEEKKRIGLAAASLIEDNDVILIEAGTTGYQTALNITGKKNLTVITNSCDIAGVLGNDNFDYKIILSGGILNAVTHALIGPVADSTFRSTFSDKAFIGISGIDIYKGITAVDPIEAQTKKHIINSAKKIIALCDSSKISHVSMNYVAPLKAVDTLITDIDADIEFIEKLKELEIEVITV